MGTNRDIKQEVLNKLYSRKGVFIKNIDNEEYVTRCPFCGDTQKRLDKGHFYININLDDNSPIYYDCKKCPAKGVMNYYVMSKLMNMETDDLLLKSNLIYLNNTCDNPDKITKYKLKLDKSKIMYDYKLPEVSYNSKIKYLEDRIGIKLNEDDYSKMRIITSLREFLYINQIKTIPFSKKMCRMIENNYIGFLNYSGTFILFRDTTNKMPDDIRWIKYQVDKNRPKGYGFYVIQTELELFTSDTIIINLSESVMNICSIAYNFNYNHRNCLNICMGGKYYDEAIKFVINKGFVGGNIIINMWSDADHRYDKKKYDTTLNYYRKHLSKYKYLFKEINVFYNLKDNDFGVPKSKIIIEKNRL